jgi:hypothetical protein
MPNLCSGNHDTTLDPPFFHSSSNKWKWPTPQDPDVCRALATSSPSLTYLEHEAATIYLSAPQTCFKIFGSPYSPGRRGWAFQYWGEDEAKRLWEGNEAMSDADIVVTHTPAHGHRDTTQEGERAGCTTLTQVLSTIRPMLHVCGHIHNARGVERVHWGNDESVEAWTDPGAGNKKLSLVDLTKKAKNAIQNTGRVTRHVLPDSLTGQPGGCQEGSEQESKSTSSLVGDALNEAGVETWRRKQGGAIECRQIRRSGVGRSEVDAVTEALGLPEGKALEQRSETVMINAAFLGQRIVGKASTFNKPIVVDVELPVWEFDSERN